MACRVGGATSSDGWRSVHAAGKPGVRPACGPAAAAAAADDVMRRRCRRHLDRRRSALTAVSANCRSWI